jgi:hypothetical protein
VSQTDYLYVEFHSSHNVARALQAVSPDNHVIGRWDRDEATRTGATALLLSGPTALASGEIFEPATAEAWIDRLWKLGAKTIFGISDDAPDQEYVRPTKPRRHRSGPPGTDQLELFK